MRLAPRAALVALAAGIALCAPSVATAGVGYPVWTTINTASLFQCPYATLNDPERSCNQGEVVNGIPSGHADDVASVCVDGRLGVSSPWGHSWRLVLNHANNHVGFIDEGFLAKREFYVQDPDCRSVGNGVWTTINHASLFQCPYAVIGDPAHSCNQGEVLNAESTGHPDDVGAICAMSFNSPWGHRWWLVINHANWHVGFIDSGFLVPQYSWFTPGPC